MRVLNAYPENPRSFRVKECQYPEHGIVVSLLKAIFLDRDGVINELIHYPEHGIVDSPFTVEQFKLFSDVARSINEFHSMGFKVVVVSNKPEIAKGNFTMETFEKMTWKMRNQLAEEGVNYDGEYYCFHHPQAKIEKYRAECDCRKPKSGLLFQASKEMGIDLSQSYMIGDGLIDIKAGKGAGCKTILLSRMKCELCKLMEDMDAKPDFVVPVLWDVVKLIRKENVK